MKRLSWGAKIGLGLGASCFGPDGTDNGGAPILNRLGRKPRYYVSDSRGDILAQP